MITIFHGQNEAAAIRRARARRRTHEDDFAIVVHAAPPRDEPEAEPGFYSCSVERAPRDGRRTWPRLPPDELEVS